MKAILSSINGKNFHCMNQNVNNIYRFKNFCRQNGITLKMTDRNFYELTFVKEFDKDIMDKMLKSHKGEQILMKDKHTSNPRPLQNTKLKGELYEAMYLFYLIRKYVRNNKQR